MRGAMASIVMMSKCSNFPWNNRANLGDLVAATDLVILLKLDSNHRLIGPCDLEIWWMTSKTTRHLMYTTSSFVHHFKSICEFKLKLQSGNAQFGSKIDDLWSCVALKFDGWSWKNKRVPLLYYIKRCAAFQNHWYIQTGVEMLNSGQSWRFLDRVTLKIDGWPWKTIGHFSMLSQALCIIL